MSEEFIVQVYQDDDPNRPHIKVYNGLIDSQLYDIYEKLLIIYLLLYSTANIDTVCTATISINNLARASQTSKATIRRRLKSLAEKGILIKQKNILPNKSADANTYKVLNYISVWDCRTLSELKEETDKLKSEILTNE